MSLISKGLLEAYENNFHLGLSLIETTSERNGYPSSLQHAIIGFENFEQAKDIADYYGLSVQSFNKKDGWQLWYRTGHIRHEAFTNSADDYGDNYREFSFMEEDIFLKEEVIPYIESFESFASLTDFIKVMDEIYNKIFDLDDNEIVITCEGRYYATINRTSMYFYNDTNHYTIGVI